LTAGWHAGEHARIMHKPRRRALPMRFHRIRPFVVLSVPGSWSRPDPLRTSGATLHLKKRARHAHWIARFGQSNLRREHALEAAKCQ
jgi:hypothetical protein